MSTSQLFKFLLTVILLIAGGSSFAATTRTLLQGSHGDRNVLPRSCQSCHRGMTMLQSGEEDVCLDCHGGADRANAMVARGYLRFGGQAALGDIEAELRKPYRHPVIETRRVHLKGEILPEEILNAKRHSECVDCHNPHVTSAERPFAGIMGKRVGNLITEIDQEYQLCYKCHSTSANLPVTSTNKAEEFKTTNPSFHPVEGEGRLAFVISLKSPYVARKQRPVDISTISCSDCHGSDNPNGAQGPHGSSYRGLLKSHYEMDDSRPESEYAYALCYQCHDRSSILGNESFAYHSRHIQGRLATGQTGTSCFTCHDPHGSTVNPYLIRFNEAVVRTNADGKIEYKQIGVAARHGKCSLNCHGVEHKEREY